MHSKNLSRFTIALALLASLGLASAQAAEEQKETSAADIKRESAELLQALKSYGAEQRDEALEKSSAALENLDRRIEALETRMLEQWEEMDEATRIPVRDVVDIAGLKKL